MSTLYKGNCDNQVQPEGGKTVGDTITRQVVIKGLKTTLLALQSGLYAKGATFEIEWTVLSTDLRDMVGGLAKLTINLVLKGSSTYTYTDALETTWEINWMSVEKALLSDPKHKLFGSYALPAEATGEGDLNEVHRQEIIDEVAAWKDSPQQRKRKYQIPLSTLTREPVANTDADWVAVGADALKVCKKIARGVEAYKKYAPVITKTSIYSYRMGTYDSSCGKIKTPSVYVPGYMYLKDGDRLVQESRKTWKRVETWQGAETIDTDLYDNG
jgi:hypothetical protein